MKKMALHNRNAFTLIELLVVVSIIALLIGISVPAFKKVRIQAKEVDSKQLISNLEAGIESFRTERALGGRLPPSSSDRVDGLIVDYVDGSGETVPSTGASLLVLAMAGPDKLGTAGFRPEAATWADSIGGYGSGGLYDTDTGTRPTQATRYGPYVGDSAMKRISNIRKVRSTGFHAPLPAATDPQDHFGEQLVFTDLLKSPILYYRARKVSRLMITDYDVSDPFDGAPGSVGIYDHRDNLPLTTFVGSKHPIWTPVPDPSHAGFAKPFDSFDSFIIDRDASGCDSNTPANCPRAIPHRAKDFLLISAGADGLWGTTDDITNWK